MNKIKYVLYLAIISSFVIACTSRTEPAPAIKEAQPLVTEKPLWQQEWDDTLVGAKKEGKLVIFLSDFNVLAKEPIVAAMKSKYGLETEIIVSRASEAVARILSERKAGIFYFDVFISGIGITVLSTLRPAGAIGDLKSNLFLLEVKEEKNWREGKIPWIDKEEKILPFAFVITPSAEINTSQVKKEELASYMDLLDSRWKGKILMNDPTTPGKGPAHLQGMDKIMGRDFLSQLAKQKPLIMRDMRLQIEWLAQGKYPISLAGIPSLVENFRKAGAPLDWVFFKEGTYIHSGSNNLIIFDNAQHSKAARLFVNWFLSREGQTLWSKTTTDVISWRADVPTDHINPLFVPKPGVKYYDLSTEEEQMDMSTYMALGKEMFASK